MEHLKRVVCALGIAICGASIINFSKNVNGDMFESWELLFTIGFCIFFLCIFVMMIIESYIEDKNEK